MLASMPTRKLRCASNVFCFTHHVGECQSHRLRENIFLHAQYVSLLDVLVTDIAAISYYCDRQLFIVSLACFEYRLVQIRVSRVSHFYIHVSDKSALLGRQIDLVSLLNVPCALYDYTIMSVWGLNLLNIFSSLYRLTTASGNWQDSKGKEQRYSLSMDYNKIHNIESKTQLHESKPGNQWKEEKKTSYDWTYSYGASQPHAPSVIGERLTAMTPTATTPACRRLVTAPVVLRCGKKRTDCASCSTTANHTPTSTTPAANG